MSRGHPARPAPCARGATSDKGGMDPRTLAAARRHAMRRRAGSIRRAVAAGSLALFIAAFLTVYVQLASGHDPALVANARRRTAAVAAGATGSHASARRTAAAREATAMRAAESQAASHPTSAGSSGSSAKSGGSSADGGSAPTTNGSAGTEPSAGGSSRPGEAPSTVRTSQS